MEGWEGVEVRAWVKLLYWEREGGELTELTEWLWQTECLSCLSCFLQQKMSLNVCGIITDVVELCFRACQLTVILLQAMRTFTTPRCRPGQCPACCRSTPRWAAPCRGWPRPPSLHQSPDRNSGEEAVVVGAAGTSGETYREGGREGGREGWCQMMHELYSQSVFLSSPVHTVDSLIECRYIQKRGIGKLSCEAELSFK